MTKEELIARLKEYAELHDAEIAHINADAALIDFINDPDVTAAFNAIDRWYA
jgi:hypothetical protein